MRILFVSNYYPPDAFGGYEMWCQEVADELSRRGHHLTVLTSRSLGLNNPANPLEAENIKVYRSLNLEVEGGLAQTILRQLGQRKRLEKENLEVVKNLISDLKPDFVWVWGMWNIPRSVPALVELLCPGKVYFYLCDYWLTLPNAYIQRWQENSSRHLTHWIKKFVSKFFLPSLRAEPVIQLKLENPVCVSKAVRNLLVQAGVSVNHAQVIYIGTKVEEFALPSQHLMNTSQPHLTLLYLGRIREDKGVETVLFAVERLVHVDHISVEIAFVGKGEYHYEKRLSKYVKHSRLSPYATFLGNLPRTEIPALLSQFDVLIFPSIWEEPFARTILEAMTAGLVVVGTLTGGTSEILVDGENGLTFPVGDANKLAEQIKRLYEDRDLRIRLANAGYKCVRERFTFMKMVDCFEALMANMANSDSQISSAA